MGDKKTPAEPAYEAMAAELNGRGSAYRCFGTEFPPGVWVDVSAALAAKLAWTDRVTVRQKEAT